jgi:hypothetical protein
MNKDNIANNPNNGASKLALLRQNRGIKKQDVDIGKAIDGFAASIDDKMMMEEIARNSAIVNLIIDCSGSMSGTEWEIAPEINEFATRQAAKIYTTKMSLTLFDDEVDPQFHKLDVRKFKPIFTWSCTGGTNIYDAIISAITPIVKADASHILHLIITDGENGDSCHSIEEVRNLITSRINCGEHIFLLYNDELRIRDSAKAYARDLGINPNNAVNFDRNGDGIKIIFQTIEDLLDGLRTSGVVPKDWAKAITAHAACPLGVKARDVKYLK